MDAAGIVRDEFACERHRRAWDDLRGVAPQKDHALAWSALALRAGHLDRTATAVNRLAVLQGPPGTGKTTLARSLAAPLSEVLDRPVRMIEFAAHEAMSGEHGRTQREVHRILTDVVPELAGSDHTVLVVDEVEALAMHRGQVSLEANPVDVHRTTDAAITALDTLADSSPNVITVMTTNFPELVDGALRSRSDVTITVPLPNSAAIEEILRSTLEAWSRTAEFADLKTLADDPAIGHVATDLAAARLDARQTRKFVLDVLSSDLSLAARPAELSATHLLEAARARKATA